MAKYKPLTSKENRTACKYLTEAQPGIFGLAEAVDVMLEKLHKDGIIKRKRGRE